MAKECMKAREAKRAKMVAKYAEKRAALKAIVKNPASSEDEVWEAQVALQKLPRDANPVRQVRRCQGYWSSTRCLPQIRSEPNQTA